MTVQSKEEGNKKKRIWQVGNLGLQKVEYHTQYSCMENAQH